MMPSPVPILDSNNNNNNNGGGENKKDYYVDANTPILAVPYSRQSNSVPIIYAEKDICQQNDVYVRQNTPQEQAPPQTSERSSSLLLLLFPIILLGSSVIRANGFGLLLLISFLYGAAFNFNSWFLPSLTLLISATSIILQTIYQIQFAVNDSTTTNSTALQFFGVFRYTQVLEFALYFSADLLVIGASVYQIRNRKSRYDTKYSKESLEKYVALSLFVTALSVPAPASSGVVFISSVVVLALWTFSPTKVTLEALRTGGHSESRRSPLAIILGEGFTAGIMIALYLYQIKVIHEQSDELKEVATTYFGFLIFPGSVSDWTSYVFAVSLLVLFCLLTALRKAPGRTIRRQRISSDSTTPAESCSEDLELIKTLLRKEPLVIRVFLEQRGVMLGSFMAILWCTSYPSYVSAILLCWSLLSVTLYGLRSPITVILLPIMALLAICINVVTYVFNLPTTSSSNLVTWGLNPLRYPFLELGFQTISTLFICWCCRTRLRFSAILNAKAARENETELLGFNATPTPAAAVLEHNSNRRENFRLRPERTKLTKLWVKDFKAVLYKYLDAIVLFTIFVVVLSTSVNLIQLGYVLIGSVFAMKRSIRQKYWRLLLIYTSVAVFAVFIWNVGCHSQSFTSDLIGLQCYNTAERWGSLWPTLFSAQLLIIIQTSLQLAIYSFVAKKAYRIQSLQNAAQKPRYFVSRILIEIKRFFTWAGVVLVYAMFLVVPLSFERPNGRNTTFIGVLQLLILFTILGAHLLRFRTDPRGCNSTRHLWRIALIIEVVIVMAKYSFQFQDVRQVVNDQWPIPSLSLDDLGLVYYAKDTGFSSLFFQLLPTGFLVLLSAWQHHALTLPPVSYGFLVDGRSLRIDRLIFIVETTKSILFMHSSKITILVTAFVGIYWISAFGALYVVILISYMPKKSWNNIWISLYLISTVVAVSQYSFQLAIFEANQTSLSAGPGMEWIGFRMVDGTTEGALWLLIQGQLYVILACTLQRASHLFHEAEKAPGFNFSTLLMRESNNSSLDGNNDEGLEEAKTVHFTAGDTVILNNSETTTPAPYLSFEDGFFTSLREFLITYSSDAALDIMRLLFVISAFHHLDIIGLFFLLISGIMLSVNRTVLKQRWWIFAIVLSILVGGQYALQLWLPTTLGYEKQDTWPWRVLSNEYQQWLALNYHNKKAVYLDFIALLSAYVIQSSHSVAVDFATARRQREDYIETAGEDFDEQRPGDANDFTWPTRKSTWKVLQFVFVSYWVTILLIIVFVTGCLQSGICAGIYLSLSIYMLYYLERVEAQAAAHGNNLLRSLRFFNWFYLALLILYQAPVFAADKQSCVEGTNSAEDGVCLSVYTTIGLFKYSKDYPDAPSYDHDIPISSIVIFVMISIQWQIFNSSSYYYIREYNKRELLKKDERRELLNRHFVDKRTQKWISMKQSKANSIQRLKIIVSKFVNKVEELMDIASGLNYSLPPAAPEPPTPSVTTQNSITISWEATESMHRIRHYRIIRQAYPSMTLLGDFADAVQVKGNVLSTTVDGLRPGTQYQFKVAGVSRMGEGPFSAPCEPVSTLPLDLDGTHSAGWMRYKKAMHFESKFKWPWESQQLFLRYVVLDDKRLTFYKNEQLALHHRSLKKRKRVRTSFLLRNVVSFALEELDDSMADESSVYESFKVVVLGRGATEEDSYTIQPEFGKNFDKWIQNLANAVPRYALDESVIQYLDEKELCLTEEAAETEGPTGSGVSTYSSETGDESWMGDNDMEEEKGKKIWWLPLYQYVFSFQDIVYRDLSDSYDEDDECGPSWNEIFRVFFNAIRSHSNNICSGTFIASFAFQGDLLNMLYVLGLFWYLLYENPRPKPKLWRFFLRYSFCVIFVRYIFQLPFFCQQLNDDFVLYPSVQPFCPTTTDYATDQAPIQSMALLGLYKFDGTVNPSVKSMFDGLKWNFLVVLSILFHRREMQLRGIWKSSKFTDGGQHQVEDLQERLRASSISSQDSIDQVTGTDLAEALASYRKVPKLDSVSLGITLVKRKMKKNKEDMSEMIALDEDLPININESSSSADTEVSGPKLLRRSSSTVSTSLSVVTNNLEPSEQIYIESRSQNGFKKWILPKLPNAAINYYTRLLPEPPRNWDKDTISAISGTKPGRDYYTSQLMVLMASILYLVLFYQYMGEPKSNDSFSVDLGDSMLSGYMVLCVTVILIFLIWDRASYLYGSLLSKLLLQYSYVFLIHLTVWILIPRYTLIYFQNRPALVIFYLLQCIYMWLGARQVKFGYRLFKRSQFTNDDRKETLFMKFVKESYELYMFVPFAFEMRALVDYVCTKTALKLSMWLLLEETAANLYLVQLEMEDRVEKSGILHGHRRQPFYRKLMTGGTLLILLLICLVGPLALFSTANPSTEKNDVVTSTLRLSVVESTTGVVHTLYENRDTGRDEFNIQTYRKDTYTQRLMFSSFAESIWTSSPPRRIGLIAELQRPSSESQVNWLLELQLQRPGPEGYQEVNYELTESISESQRELLATAVNATEALSEVVTIEEFYNPVLEVSATSGARAYTGFASRSISLQKRTDEGVSWWVITSSDDVAYAGAENIEDDDKITCDDEVDEGMCFATLSLNIVTGLSSLGIGAYGITAVYIFVLFTIGSFVKDSLRGALFTVIYTELPDPKDLLDLCEGVYIAREEKYIGHLKDEVRLYETLIRVLRSPETLLRVTGQNVLHIPEKSKQD